jgi:DNA-binding Lrp family transcriptional regulator
MQQVLILMTVEPTLEKEVLDKLRKLPMAIETHFLYGPYDVYVKAEAKTTAELERFVLNDIRNIKGIRSTITCFVAD